MVAAYNAFSVTVGLLAYNIKAGSGHWVYSQAFTKIRVVDSKAPAIHQYPCP